MAERHLLMVVAVVLVVVRHRSYTHPSAVLVPIHGSRRRQSDASDSRLLARQRSLAVAGQVGLGRGDSHRTATAVEAVTEAEHSHDHHHHKVVLLMKRLWGHRHHHHRVVHEARPSPTGEHHEATWRSNQSLVAKAIESADGSVATVGGEAPCWDRTSRR